MTAVTAPVSSLCYSSSLAPFVQLPLLRLFELLDLIQKRDLLESNLRNWNVIRAANKLISWNPSRKCLSFLFSLFLRHRFLSCILGIIYFSRENKKRKETRKKRILFIALLISISIETRYKHDFRWIFSKNKNFRERDWVKICSKAHTIFFSEF